MKEVAIMYAKPRDMMVENIHHIITERGTDQAVVDPGGSKPGSLILLVVTWLLLATPVNAATFIVDSEVDATDQNPGDGVCATASGNCSLRAAIQETNALAGLDVVQVPPGLYLLTLAGSDENNAATGDLDILDDLTVEGVNPFATTIDGGHLDRVFDVGPNVESPDVTGISVTLRLLRITNGDSVGGGGGILYHSELLLEHMIVVENVTQGSGGGVGDSNGFFDNPRLTVFGSIISLNRAETLSASGGGISGQSAEHLTVQDSVVIANHAAQGGGGMQVNGSAIDPVIIDRTTVYGNSTGGNILTNGGGINGSCMQISNSDISQNRVGEFGSDFAGSPGGGIQNVGSCGASIVNSTIHGNLAEQGGGISNSGELSLVNVTIGRNAAVEEGGGIFQFGVGASTSMVNTIVAENIPVDCAGGDITSNGHNLASDNSCNLVEVGDLPNTNPQMGPLNLNGGPTRTLALLAGSPALDAGTNTGLTTDQRGVLRPQGAAFDIGAYEQEAGRAARFDARCDLNRDRVVNSLDLDIILNTIESQRTHRDPRRSFQYDVHRDHLQPEPLEPDTIGRDGRDDYDINRDGTVSVDDYQICVTACTSPACGLNRD